jgi:hypothetical protein
MPPVPIGPDWREDLDAGRPSTALGSSRSQKIRNEPAGCPVIGWSLAQVHRRDMRIADLKPGWDVLTNDGHRLGKIREVGQHFVEVSGGFFSAPLYVPASAIGNVENETVHLKFAHGEVDTTGWRRPPRSPDELHTARERDADREI